jgi:hypothetical protein
MQAELGKHVDEQEVKEKLKAEISNQLGIKDFL